MRYLPALNAFKYFIGYKDARPSCIFLPKISVYRIDVKLNICLFE